MKTWSTVLLVHGAMVLTVLLGSGGEVLPEDGKRQSPQDLVHKWDALPPEALRTLWDEAQGTGGVVAVEPDTQIVGPRAAEKKTWTLADRLLRFFVYGEQPNWFPADLVRRTVCGPDPRWAYFWHLLSGDERDLHPWLDGEKGFDELLGEESGAFTGSGALNLASCEEVKGPSKACLYGEVTPREGFEQWFCGGRGMPCLAQLTASPQDVPADLRKPDEFCMYGPWVLERVHEWRPEIHPAEVFWVRSNRGRNGWTFALVPDDSDRFDRDKYFEKASWRPAAEWRPWSSDRPVELWVAFSVEGGKPLVFDLAVKVFDKRPQAARQATLTPPVAGAGFTVLPHTLPGVLAASKSWTEPSCGCTRGLLVLRATVHGRDKQALVLRLKGRAPDESPPPSEIEGAAVPAGLVAPVAPPAVAASLRLFGVAKLGPAALPNSVAVNTLVRFDPRRPTEPADEQAADRKNEALKAKAADRLREFGTERPFRVEWSLEATRDDTGEPVTISAPGLGPISGGASAVQVEVVSFPGPATAAVLINGRDLAAGLGGRATEVSLGQLLVTVPPGITVTGQGRIYYQGTVPLDLPTPAARVVFRVPPRRYANEWDLVSQVLAEIDPATSAHRLAELEERACAPAPAAECPTEPLSPGVAASLADPVARWTALRELRIGGRPFARFVRLFARGLLWDGEVTDDERELMKRLLQAWEGSGGGIARPSGSVPPRRQEAKEE